MNNARPWVFVLSLFLNAFGTQVKILTSIFSEFICIMTHEIILITAPRLDDDGKLMILFLEVWFRIKCPDNLKLIADNVKASRGEGCDFKLFFLLLFYHSTVTHELFFVL